MPSFMKLEFEPFQVFSLTVSIQIADRHYRFWASNVVNDPLSELLMAAIWLVDPALPLPDLPARLNPPIADDDTRSVHFWREPAWHTLAIQKLDNATDVRFLFYEDHEGSLSVTPDDLRYSVHTAFDQSTIVEFARQVYRETQSLLLKTPLAVQERCWGCALARELYHTLAWCLAHH